MNHYEERMNHKMKPKTIETNATFRLNDVTSRRAENACPVIGCRETTSVIGKHPVCPLHGLEIHKATFVYYNGASHAARTQACLRNLLPFRKDFAAEHILDSSHKLEAHRLGHENSEDALTWNIFGGLLHYERLHRVYNLLTSAQSSASQLALFLWGIRIDFDSQAPELWPRLAEFRRSLEPDIDKFPTEPDIMLLGPTHLLCIEAKFCSGNPLAVDAEVKPGEKPKSRQGLMDRYLRGNKLWPTPAIKPEDLGEVVHSQLLRNLVFASTVGQLEGRDWMVANLVSKTQWKNRRKVYGYDFTDPTPSIPAVAQSRFKFISWEDEIYNRVLKDDPVLAELAEYMRTKTVNLTRAFSL